MRRKSNPMWHNGGEWEFCQQCQALKFRKRVCPKCGEKPKHKAKGEPT